MEGTVLRKWGMGGPGRETSNDVMAGKVMTAKTVKPSNLLDRYISCIDIATQGNTDRPSSGLTEMYCPTIFFGTVGEIEYGWTVA